MRERAFEYLRRERLCGDGISLFSRGWIRDMGCSISHGISHFARDHGIIPNPVRSRGKNPGEGPEFNVACRRSATVKSVTAVSKDPARSHDV